MNLSEMTEQEVFDTVKEHLLTQNQRSIDGTLCKYRGPMGLKCAAGILIDDEDYDTGMEGEMWLNLVSIYSIPDRHSGLIAQLQFIHDNIEIENWSSELKELASYYNINY